MKKHTNKKITFDCLNAYFLQSDNTINEDYLNEHIQIIGMNTAWIYDKLKTRRCKAHSIAWAAFAEMTNDIIRAQGYDDYYASNDQLKQWLNTYGSGYETIADSVTYFFDERNNLLGE